MPQVPKRVYLGGGSGHPGGEFTASKMVIEFFGEIPLVQGAPPNSWIQLESITRPTVCSTFCKGKIQNNNPELPRIPLFFRFQRFRSCQGVTNSCRSHWKRLQRSNCSLIQAAMGCKAIGKMEGFPQLVRFYLNFAGFFSWDKTHKNGGFTIRNWDLTEKKGEFSFIHGILKGVYGFIVWEII